MSGELLHRFELGDKRYVIDPETCFCFECDAISWDVLEYYPQTSINRIVHLLRDKHDAAELLEVIGELEWLRATKSILPIPKQEDLKKKFEVERGVRTLSIRLSRDASEAEAPRRGWFGQKPGAAVPKACDIATAAIGLLLSRSEAQKDLRLEFVEDGYVHDPELIGALCAQALKAARLAGKNLTVAVRVADAQVAKPPQALDGHTLGFTLELQDASEAAKYVRALAKEGASSLSAWAKAVEPGADGVSGRVVIRPNHPEFGGAVEVLDEAGFGVIELDMDGAYVAHPELDPAAMLDGVSQAAHYYANRLLKHHYFRLDPIGALFWRIYQGEPRSRSDPSGTNELAVDERGDVYPSMRFLGIAAFCAGSLASGSIDESRLKQFEDVGALTTVGCPNCWARNLCGGGSAAVHYALTGSFRTPNLRWCDAQRAWMGAAVSAFNVLSSAGVNFTRVYKTLGRTAKPSLFTMARAAFRMSIGVRPIEESDAQTLTDWENWNPGAYFTCHEAGTLLATRYDREMDSLHPRGIDQELVLIRKDGTPFGLLKVRPDRMPGLALAWVYLCDEADYAAEGVRKSFRFILKEAGTQQQGLRRLIVPATPFEKPLETFLESVGFERAGVQREALYLHGAYHDVTLFAIGMENL